jgi:hypothetical protein
MDERRRYLKQLASRSSRSWAQAPLPPALAGETRIETRNTVYRLRDGVCYAVTRHEEAAPARTNPSAFAGMRLVGWLMREDPRGGLSLEWTPGACAVLWRPRGDGEAHSAVALTSSTLAFATVARSVPPPLPARAMTVRPPTPLPPPPPSMTRLHFSDVPPAPETPTPPRRASSIPPPLPPRARAIPPLPPRVPLMAAPTPSTPALG